MEVSLYNTIVNHIMTYLSSLWRWFFSRLINPFEQFVMTRIGEFRCSCCSNIDLFCSLRWLAQLCMYYDCNDTTLQESNRISYTYTVHCMCV